MEFISNFDGLFALVQYYTVTVENQLTVLFLITDLTKFELLTLDVNENARKNSITNAKRIDNNKMLIKNVLDDKTSFIKVY